MPIECLGQRVLNLSHYPAWKILCLSQRKYSNSDIQALDRITERLRGLRVQTSSLTTQYCPSQVLNLGVLHVCCVCV